MKAQSHNWIPSALNNPRMTLGIACSVPYVIEQDAVDKELSTRVYTIVDNKIRQEEN